MTKKKNGSFKGRIVNTSDLKSLISREMRKSPNASFSAAKLIKTLKIANNRPEVEKILSELTKDRRIRESASGTFKHSNEIKGKIYIGKADVIRSGGAYIIVENLQQDIYVGPSNTLGAMSGDTVEVMLTPRPGRRKPEGKILRIVKRSRDIYMGKLFLNRNYGVVLPYKAPTGLEIYVAGDGIQNGQDGDIVTVKVTHWPSGKDKQIRGQINEVIGQEDSKDVQMKSILVGQGFNLSFSPEAMAIAETLSDEVTEQDLAERRDMRDVTTITIDPFNAKDFDDALSVKVLDEGKIEIGVHIADVTHFLKEGNQLDKEAFERSTSVYLVDRVLPMLPEKISNELCSLRPHEDKMTFSAIFTMNESYEIVDRWFGKTIIHSDRRFTYEEAQVILESGEGDYAEELALLGKISKKLSKERFAKGAIGFESDEVQFRLDEHGMPIELFVKERKEAHMLVEDFMLLANKAVAEFIKKKGSSGEIPFVYRIHDLPNEEKLNDFALFAAEFGFKMDLTSPKSIADSFNKLATETENNDALKLLAPLAIRTMSKAEYSTNNIGHYGLAFENYSHFTSPIRRYSDVLAHRILYRNLGDTIYREDKEKLEIKCKYISAQERKAMEAERESIKFFQVEFMSQYVGQEFDGMISGFHDKGIFVELVANMCEGMVAFDSLGELFIVEEGKLKARGRISGRMFKMGDNVRIKVVDTDLDRRRIEFEMVEESE